jgi:hypothetical protein
MPDDLSSTVGIVAMAAALVAVVALIIAIVLAVKLRRMRAAQLAVLGDSETRDLVAHAQTMQSGFVDLRELVESTFSTVERRLGEHTGRIDLAISHAAVVRYDAYGEMSGRQSSSMALLDEHGTGLVLSSILHRDQARMYVKDVQSGESQFELSPEEKEAIATALRSHEGVQTATGT